MDTCNDDAARVAEAVSLCGMAVVIAEGYAYTVGHTTYVVAGLSDELMGQVLDRVYDGRQVFTEYFVKIVPADPGTVDLEYARPDAPVKQVLWPDVYGVYPDEDNYRGAEQVLYY